MGKEGSMPANRGGRRVVEMAQEGDESPFTSGDIRPGEPGARLAAPRNLERKRRPGEVLLDTGNVPASAAGVR